MSAEGAKVCESGFVPMPEFERSFVCRERRMRRAVFDMNRGLDSERPIPIAEVRVNIRKTRSCFIVTFCAFYA